MVRDIQVYAPHASIQTKLQGLVMKLKAAKAAIAQGNADVEAVKKDFYDFADNAYGPGTYVMYEGKGEVEHLRIVREIQEPRTYDLDGLRRVLTPGQFASITKTVIDLDALDNALARKEIDDTLVAEFCEYGVKPTLQLRPTGPRSEVKLNPGRVAVLSREHDAVQEGAA